MAIFTPNIIVDKCGVGGFFQKQYDGSIAEPAATGVVMNGAFVPAMTLGFTGQPCAYYYYLLGNMVTGGVYDITGDVMPVGTQVFLSLVTGNQPQDFLTAMTEKSPVGSTISNSDDGSYSFTNISYDGNGTYIVWTKELPDYSTFATASLKAKATRTNEATDNIQTTALTFSDTYDCEMCGGSGSTSDHTYVCNECDGTGEVEIECPDCAGKGEICDNCNGSGQILIHRCTTCQGAGWIDDEACPECDGEGDVYEECPECNGVGHFPTNCDTCDGEEALCTECSRCNGTGYIGDCDFCSGAGKVQYPRWSGIISGQCPADASVVYISRGGSNSTRAQLEANIVHNVIPATNEGADASYSIDVTISTGNYVVWCVSETAGMLTATLNGNYEGTGGTEGGGEDDPVCLSGDTIITMADGSGKRFDELVVGDKILAGDSHPTTALRIGRGVWRPSHTLYHFEDGTIIDEISEHRFYNVEQGFWQKLHLWNIGEHAKRLDGANVALVRVERVEEEAECFGLWTESDDYFANGLLSGNAGANRPLLADATLEQAMDMAISLSELEIEKMFYGGVL